MIENMLLCIPVVGSITFGYLKIQQSLLEPLPLISRARIIWAILHSATIFHLTSVDKYERKKLTPAQ